ncbi:SIR2 family protein [Pseudarthrobacter sp. NPDC092439]|uniref:SIR2 family protein n=1 Tax=unclassified Pseudarthrobacter TaxID=2647000 RepID=UPI00381242F3
MTSPAPHEDALLALAFSVRANPGGYAVLLGAGVSAPSGILTAWGIVEDLIGRIADLIGQSRPDDPAAWYEERYSEPARYENLLEKLAPSPLERQRLLREYFEPADPEDDSPDRKPTLAHRSIARLVKTGTIRVIVTLNFDRLMEQALRAEGIEPTIVASAADVAGMAPVHTLKCCVVHLHGDYLNPASMLNTTAELDSYGPQMLDLLHRIIKDYGLILAGWSGTYDPALVDAIKTNYPARYTLTWIEPRTQTPPATEFLTLMGGLLLPTDADTAFGLLADSVGALNSRRARHPLTPALAADTAKRELSGRWVAIGLHDTLGIEFERLHRIPEVNLQDYQQEAPDGYLAMLERVEEASKVPGALVAATAYWGNEQSDNWWIDELERFSRRPRVSGLVKLQNLRRVAGTNLFYAAGIAAQASKRYSLVGKLLSRRTSDPYEGEQLLANILEADRALENTPSRLYRFLRPLLEQSLSITPAALEDAWQQFEVLRIVAAIMSDSRYSQLLEGFHQEESKLLEAQEAFERAESVGSGIDEARVLRAQAAQSRDRSLGELAHRAPVRGAHLLAVDRRLDERWHCPVAEHLARELDIEGDAHPLVQAGLGKDATALSVAARAASAAVGSIAHDLSWRDVGPGFASFIPDEIWIDSGKTPSQIASR